MEKSINLRILEAKDGLIKVINDSQLPAMVMQMVFNEVGMSLNQSVHQTVQQEQQELQQEQHEVPKVNAEVVGIK